MLGRLPDTLTVAGKEYKIRTDFRDILTILTAFADPDLTDRWKAYVCLKILYVDYAKIPPEAYEEAYSQASFFIDAGAPKKEEKSPHKLIDWEQDERLLFPSINRVAGCEVRSLEYLHWWTFLGYFMEISDDTYSCVLSLRQKKARGKKLEDWEKDFWNSNKDICVIKKRISSEQQAEMDRLNELFR